MLLYLLTVTITMDGLYANLRLQVNENIYLKNPESSDLGQRIISGSIELISEIGFERFTFRKLAAAISSTEASIYRYFESKHKLLLYLTAWYWAWVQYRMLFATANVESAEDRLKRALDVALEVKEVDIQFPHIDEQKLYRLVVAESSKAYLNKQVDEINDQGVYTSYKDLVELISKIILEINPNYKYPHMLVSTVIEGSNHQHFFAQHLPRLTDVVCGESGITEYYQEMVLTLIKAEL